METRKAQSSKGNFEHGAHRESYQENGYGEKEANGKQLIQLLSHFDNAFEDAFFEVLIHVY